ncbi:hypothetical protein NEDG_01295 [Nematocida displodere]|uniref:Coatomer subunit zeta n=1 Tax=Nematocida displodere TaxID=1805483 RepID=A0A177EDI4_9MICR|nr:hypothetical protein NEDG_01295 [Nematocida displodere]
MSGCNIVKGLAIVGENGARLLGTPLVVGSEVKDMEVKMFSKAKETEGSILLFDDSLVLYKIVEDLCIILYAPIEENEIALSNALDAFYTACVKVIRGPLSQKSLAKHYDEVFLLIDAFIYKTILITDSAADLIEKVPKRSFEGLDGAIQMPTKFSSVFKKAQKSFPTSWFKM